MAKMMRAAIVRAFGKPLTIEETPIPLQKACQAGWQTLMIASIRPDPMGPIVVVGSPSVLGGTWLTELSGDLIL